MLRFCVRFARERRLQAQAWSILTMRSDYKNSAMAIFSVFSEPPNYMACGQVSSAQERKA
jgi:hypothetical protein